MYATVKKVNDKGWKQAHDLIWELSLHMTNLDPKNVYVHTHTHPPDPDKSVPG